MAHEIPYPLGNMINGGAHAGKNAPDIQEFLVIPVGAENITEAVFTNVNVHRKIRELIQAKDTSLLVVREMKEDGHPTSPAKKPWRYSSRPARMSPMKLVWR